jgi:hypothetical protein
MAAAADMELVTLAHLAAKAERKPAESIEQLIAGGFLPQGFGLRSDGSRAVLQPGQVNDQLRGRRGALLPIVDMNIEAATAAEVEAYRQFAEAYRRRWVRPAPISVAVQRRMLAADKERVSLDIDAGPIAGEAWEALLEQAGPPKKLQFAPIAGDFASFELRLSDQRIFGGLSGLHWLPNSEEPSIISIPLVRLRDMVSGYLGSTGELGLLSIVDRMIAAPPDAAGFAPGRLGLWRRYYGEYTLYSFQPEVLERVGPQLKLVQAPREAQARFRMGDPSTARLAVALNELGYRRTYQTVLGNLRLLHVLAQQLRVPPDTTKQVAESLLDARMVCPLGGEYVYRAPVGETPHWTSTSLERTRDAFVAPPLNWLGGLQLDALAGADHLSGHVEVDMQWLKACE